MLKKLRAYMQRTTEATIWFFLIVRLFKNWAQIYYDHYILKAPKRMFRLRERGICYEADNKNLIVPLIVEIWHEKNYGDLMWLNNIERPVVIDIGANIGAFALYALTRNKDARVFCYEPEEKNFASLVRNLELNHMSNNCSVMNEAVCRERGTRSLFVSDVQSGKNTLFNIGKSMITKEIKVTCTTLSDIMRTNDITSCSLLKLDCEGAEYEIILGTERLIFEKISCILLEWHRIPGFESPNILIKTLESYGYTVNIGKVGNILVARM